MLSFVPNGRTLFFLPLPERIDVTVASEKRGFAGLLPGSQPNPFGMLTVL
jgi:hypothetical protein